MNAILSKADVRLSGEKTLHTYQLDTPQSSTFLGRNELIELISVSATGNGLIARVGLRRQRNERPRISTCF
jgi:hypothetical protein